MRERLTTSELLDRLLLIAIQDGADRFLFRALEGTPFCHEFTAWVRGERFELVPPPEDDVEALPAELARREGLSLPPPDNCAQRVRPDIEIGSFQFPIAGGAVAMCYRVQCGSSGVAELEIRVAPAAQWADAARARLEELSRPSYEESIRSAV
jgi:hypothetical protein